MAAETVPSEFIGFAEELADAARTVVARYFRTGFDVIAKQDESPVTIADREAESAIRALIEDRYPDHGIFGEEHGKARLDARYVWVLDPIDGTRAFIAGLPTFGTLIALADRGVPVLGVLDQPILKERWIGALGHGTTFNGSPVRTRDCGGLNKASLYTTGPDLFNTDARRDAFYRLHEAVQLPRFGGDCYSTGLIASGCVDLHVECGHQPYDYMALAPIIQAAGGIATTWAGHALTLTSGDTFLGAASESVHAPAKAFLAASE